MSGRNDMPFRADQVGSLLRPQGLKDARDKAKAGGLSREALAELEDRLIRDAVRRQEEVGLHAVTDGDFRRQSWSGDFLTAIEGVQMSPPPAAGNRPASQPGEVGGVVPDWQPPTPHTVAKLRWPKGGITRKGFEFLAPLTTETPKVTMPSPTMLHFRGGRGGVDKSAYPDMDGFFADCVKVWQDEITDLAAAGCKYVQLDDTNLAYLCDERLRARVRELGEDPDALPHTYARLINQAIGKRPADVAVTIHLCRGNSVSRGMAEGGYEPVAEALFNEMEVDGFFLEYDSERAGGLEPLRFVPKGDKRIVLGFVTSKFGELETKDAIKRRIDEAAKYAPVDQLCLSPQCGFASHTVGNLLSEEQQWAKLRFVVEVAEEVWGA